MNLTKKQKPLTPEALSKLAKAREAMTAQGISPRARGAEKARAALDWIYRWGWASTTSLECLTGGKRTNLTTRLIKNKLVQATKTESGGGVKGIPIFMFTLTSVGIDEVERMREDLLNYQIDPYRIDQSKLRHDQIAQTATINSLKNGTIESFKTPLELSAKSEKGVKQPDVLWIQPSGIRIGIEVELSAKWERKLDQFVLSCLESIQEKPTGPMPNDVDVIALVSDSRAILKRYTKAFTPGESLGIWEKDSRSIWRQQKTIEVPQWSEGKLLCKFVE